LARAGIGGGRRLKLEGADIAPRHAVAVAVGHPRVAAKVGALRGIRRADVDQRGAGQQLELVPGLLAEAGSATGTGHVAADENPVDIAQKCSGSGLRTAHLDLDLATTPSISG
jgi:hypothetical protein